MMKEFLRRFRREAPLRIEDDARPVRLALAAGAVVGALTLILASVLSSQDARRPDVPSQLIAVRRPEYSTEEYFRLALAARTDARNEKAPRPQDPAPDPHPEPTPDPPRNPAQAPKPVRPQAAPPRPARVPPPHDAPDAHASPVAFDVSAAARPPSDDPVPTDGWTLAIDAVGLAGVPVLARHPAGWTAVGTAGSSQNRLFVRFEHIIAPGGGPARKVTAIALTGTTPGLPARCRTLRSVDAAQTVLNIASAAASAAVGAATAAALDGSALSGALSGAATSVDDVVRAFRDRPAESVRLCTAPAGTPVRLQIIPDTQDRRDDHAHES